MSGWVTIDRKALKQQQDRDRKARRKAEKEAEAAALTDIIGGEADYIVGAPKVVPSRAPVVAPSAAAQIDSTIDEERRAARAILLAEKKKEQERVNRRKEAAAYARAARDPSHWPYVSAKITEQHSEIRQAIYSALKGIPHAELSYNKAVYAADELEKALRNTVAGDVEASDVLGVYGLPLVSVNADAAAARAISSIASTYFTFGADGDHETMVRLWTSFFGEKGSKDTAHGQGNGLKLATQLLIQCNLGHALNACGALVNAFVAVESNRKFHTQASFKNFLTIVHSIVTAVCAEAEKRDASERSFTLLQVRNAFIAILHALSMDGCERWGTAALAVALLQQMAFALEVIGDMQITSQEAKTSKVVFLPLEEEAVRFLVQQFPNAAVDERAASRVGLVLLSELCLSHYHHSPRLLFAPTLFALESQLVTSKGPSASHVGWVETLLANIVSQRGADVFPTWGECFHKTETASSKVLTLVVKNGATIDSKFMAKVQGRVEKRAANVQQGLEVLGKALAEAMQTAAKKGKVGEVAHAKRTQPKERNDEKEATHRESETASSKVWSVVKFAVVVAATAAVWLQAKR